ncbi:MAG: flagellar hook-basal body complex protein FliE [Panacagrimonas sp.]
MNDIDVNRILSQIRSLQPQTANRVPPFKAPTEVSPGFGDMLTRSLDRVAATQGESARLQRSFELGEPGADLSRVMLASARAQVEFRGAVEVRNRLVAAYQDIMNMPI